MGTPSGTRSTTRRAPARRGQGAALRDEILTAATALIASSGDVATLTLRAVAREVGVAATSIYLHFSSVEELLTAVKAHRFSELADALTAAAEAVGTDPLARLRARAHAYVRFGAEHPGEYAVMFAARLVPTDGSVPVRPTITVDLFDAIGAALARVRRLGLPPIAADEAEMITFHLWTSLHGMVSLRMLRPHMGWPSVDDEVDDLVQRLVGPTA
jgi:AcrR family transcriptional regulator